MCRYDEKSIPSRNDRSLTVAARKIYGGKIYVAKICGGS
jgi:hypothetical protein